MSASPRRRALPSKPRHHVPTDPIASWQRWGRTVASSGLRPGARRVALLVVGVAVEGGGAQVYAGSKALAARSWALDSPTARSCKPVHRLRSVKRSLMELVEAGWLVDETPHNRGGRVVGGRAQANVFRLAYPYIAVVPMGVTPESPPVRSAPPAAPVPLRDRPGGDSGVTPLSRVYDTPQEVVWNRRSPMTPAGDVAASARGASARSPSEAPTARPDPASQGGRLGRAEREAARRRELAQQAAQLRERALAMAEQVRGDPT